MSTNSGGAKSTDTSEKPPRPSRPSAASTPARDKVSESAGAPKDDAEASPKPKKPEANGSEAKAEQTVRIRPSKPAGKPWTSADESPTPVDGVASVGAGATAPVRPPASAAPAGTPAPSSSFLGRSADTATTAPAGRGQEQRATAKARGPRKAHLVLRRVEPWSAMKFSFVLSLVCFVILFVAVAVLYGVLSGLGVFDSIISTVNQFTTADGEQTGNLDIESWFAPGRILGFTALLGAVNVVLITALATLGAVIYNVAADLVGGIEVTFSEAE